MSLSASALEFIFNTKSFAGLEVEGMKYFLGSSVADNGTLPVLLTEEEMTYLELAPNPASPGEKNGAIKARNFLLNEEQRQSLQDFQLNQLKGFTEEQRAQLVFIRNELVRLLFSEVKKKTDIEKAAFAEQKKAFFELVSSFTYSLERNGVVNEHAQKLDKLFPTLLGATSYANIWLNTHQDLSHPLHDLCMAINFPEPPATVFPAFRDWGPLHTKEMFANAKLLVLYTRYYPLLINKFGLNRLAATSAEDFGSAIDDFVMRTELKDIISEGQIVSDEDRDIIKRIVQINTRFKRAKYQDVGRVLDVLHQAKNSDAVLPNSTLTSEGLDLFEGLTMRKLDTMDPVAPLFGNFTGCCQRIGGQGETCAIHSVTSDKGGVYVLEWKKSILAGSWTWYSEENRTLCFDSVEIDSQTKKEVAEELKKMGLTLPVNDFINLMYTEFAQRLMKDNPHIEQVLVGTNGQTPAEMGFSAQSRFGMSLVSPDGYPKSGYRDSRTVRVLARKDEVMYQLHALNKGEIFEKIFKDKKTSSQDFFRVFSNFLDDEELLNEYFIGDYTHIKTVTSLSNEAALDTNTIYLIKGKDNQVTAHFYKKGAGEESWVQRTIDAGALPANTEVDEFIDENHHRYSTIVFFAQVTSLCGLPPSRISAAGMKVPEWFQFVFDKGTVKNYSAEEIHQLVALVKDPGFMVPGTSETLVYAALARGDFATVHALMPQINKEIIDIGNEEESCLVLCGKKLNSLEPTDAWYSMAIELLDKGGDPNYGDVDGDGFVHHLCKKIQSIDVLKDFLQLAEEYKFDLSLPDDERITPLHFVAKNLQINTFAQIDVLFAELAESGIHHKLDYMSFSNALILSNNAEDLGALRNYLSALDWSQIKHEDFYQFFANPSICQEAKAILFHSALEHLEIEEERASLVEHLLGTVDKVKPNIIQFQRLFAQINSIYPDDLHTYLNAMTVKNTAEYEQLKLLFKTAGITCTKSLYSFYETLVIDDEELINLQDYIKKNPPTLLELKQMTEGYLREPKGNPQAKYTLVLILESLPSGEDKWKFLLDLLTHVNNAHDQQLQDVIQVNPPFDLNEDFLCKSFMSYLQSMKTPYANNFATQRAYYKELLNIMKDALTSRELELLRELILEQSKQPRQLNDYSGYFWWYTLQTLERSNSDQFNWDKVDSSLSKIARADPDELKEIRETFNLNKGQKVSVAFFAELESLCFALEVADSPNNPGVRRKFEEDFSKELSHRFFKNEIVLEEKIFDAMLKRYQGDLNCLNRRKINPLFEKTITNLMVRSALSYSEQNRHDLRNVLESTPLWGEDVKPDAFDNFFTDDAFPPPIAQLELYINLYLLKAQSKTERKERCDLLLNKFQEIAVKPLAESYPRDKSITQMREIVEKYAHTLSQHHSVSRSSFFQPKAPADKQKKSPGLEGENDVIQEAPSNN